MRVELKDGYLEKVLFQRDTMLPQQRRSEMPTEADSDIHKVPLINDLLKQMYVFYFTLQEFGIEPSKENDRGMLGYELVDKEHDFFPGSLKIDLYSNWFDPRHPLALHANFHFILNIVQDVCTWKPMEFSDSLRVTVKHLNTAVFSWISRRDCCRASGMIFKNPKDSFFSHLEEIPYEKTVRWDNGGSSFKKGEFSQSVKDACIAMQVIMDRAEYMKSKSIKEIV